MKRADILAAYKVDDMGVIVSPGQFEATSIFTPHFWEATLDGTAEELDYMQDGAGQYVALVAIEPEDFAEFPEIPAGMAFAVVTQSEQGFIGCELCDAKRADELRAEYASEEESDE